MLISIQGNEMSFHNHAFNHQLHSSLLARVVISNAKQSAQKQVCVPNFARGPLRSVAVSITGSKSSGRRQVPTAPFLPARWHRLLRAVLRGCGIREDGAASRAPTNKSGEKTLDIYQDLQVSFSKQ